MLTRVAKLLLLTALMVSIGGQWALIQAVAWTRMVVVYSAQTGSVTEGLSRTFDGSHPCRMCCLVKHGTESDQKDPKQQETSKLKIELFAEVPVTLVLAAPLSMQTFVMAEEAVIERDHTPPTPPPRCGSASFVA